MDPLLTHISAYERQIVALIRQFVECESPSDDPAAVNRFVELVSDTIAPIARVKTHAGGRFGKHLVCEMQTPERRKSGQILALGHSDTVWPMGTLRSMPFRVADGRLWGPGVLDMKAGIAFLIFAVRALRDLEIPTPSKVVLQLNSDEEVGSESSRPLTEKNAAASKAVLVLEPGTGLEGKLKTARKGVGDYTVTVRGKGLARRCGFRGRRKRHLGTGAATRPHRRLHRSATRHHSESRSHRRGQQIERRRGGSTCRGRHPRSQTEGRSAFGEEVPFLKPIDRRCSIDVTGGLNRPPMERSAGIVKLFRTAQKLAREIGVKLEESLTGGGSDGNFTAALGIPTLDGLGAVGEGAHASNESILSDRIVDRTALIAKLLAAL
ncbi:MAG: M20/M25/M40 family metallo-hydrolase [Ignavibacteriota bacterium]